jgi:porin
MMSRFARTPSRAWTDALIGAVMMIGALALAVPAFAQTSGAAGTGAATATTPAAPAQDPLTVQDWVKRPYMFGDWGGKRTRLEEKSFKFDATWTQFFAQTRLQPPYGDTMDGNYGGRADFKATYDFSHIEGAEGVSVTGHLMFRYGDTTTLAGGTLLPTNTALLFPENEGAEFDFSSLYVTRTFSNSVTIQAGRFDLLEAQRRPFTGGEGLDRFQNMAFVFLPLHMRTLPPSAEGAIFTQLRNGEPLVTVGLVESTEDGFFKNGATVFGVYDQKLSMFAAPGKVSVRGTMSSINATSLDDSKYLFIPEYTGEIESVTGAWSLDVAFEQYIWWDPATKKGWGLFGAFGFSDGNPSFIDMFGHFGVGGASPIRSRPDDTFGVGYYLGGVSQTFRDSVGEVLRLRNENGFEGYYDFAVTGWSKVAADFQVIDPFAVGSKTRWFFTARWKLIF